MESSSDSVVERPMIATENVNNLEYLPMEVLLKIFAKIDDIGLTLVYLAEISNRFAAIAPIVFEERYANKYFVINSEHEGGDPELYGAVLNRFGKSIKAFEINDVEKIDDDHWLAKMLQPHIQHIEKLTFNSCDFESNNILSRAVNVTQLVLQDLSFPQPIDLPDCRNLNELEIRNSIISTGSLEQTIRNNPTLQSLSLNGVDINQLNVMFIAEDTNQLNVMFIAEHLNQIKDLALMSGISLSYHQMPGTTDQIVNSFKHLESLALSNDSFEHDTTDLLKLIGTECKRIKYLELHEFDLDDPFMEAVRSFQRIESLYLLGSGDGETEYISDFSNLIQLIQDLPKLRHLGITAQSDIYENVVLFFRESSSLEKITIGCEYEISYQETFKNAQLFGEFIEIITNTNKPHARIDVKQNGEIFGSMTGNRIVWRNKVMHWMGCNENHSSSNVQLLDLAKHPSKQSAGTNENLLDRIFDYLDIYSLCSIGETGKRSKQLVDNYIEKHSEHHGAFTITDEFVWDDDLGFKNIHFQPKIFARYVTNLHVCPIYEMHHIVKLMHSYKHLDTVTMRNDYSINDWGFTLQQVQHFIYDTPSFSGYSKLYEILPRMPNVQTIEFKRASRFDDFKSDKRGRMDCNRLKKFIFNYRGETQMENVKEIFANTNTELVPIL